MKMERACYTGWWKNEVGKDNDFIIRIESCATGAISEIGDLIMQMKTKNIHDMDIGPASGWMPEEDSE